MVDILTAKGGGTFRPRTVARASMVAGSASLYYCTTNYILLQLHRPKAMGFEHWGNFQTFPFFWAMKKLVSLLTCFFHHTADDNEEMFLILLFFLPKSHKIRH